jgi:hypothetical protein
MWYDEVQHFAELAILLGHESVRFHEEMVDE